MLDQILKTVKNIEEGNFLSQKEITEAKRITNTYDHSILSQGAQEIHVQIESKNTQFHVKVSIDEDEELFLKINGESCELNLTGLAAFYVIIDQLSDEPLSGGKKYTRKGMIKRVLDERMDKAKKAEYKVFLSDNLYGEHTLINEKGKAYQVTLRDFNAKTGYINNIDWKSSSIIMAN